MNVLDSRILGPTNCFIQKITEPGEVVFETRKAAAGFLPLAEHMAHRVKVKDLKLSKAKMRARGGTHHIAVHSQKGAVQIGDTPGEVELGDALLFHNANRDGGGFAVSGRMGKQVFSSAELRDQAVFTHAFGLPGRYEWADANGSGVEGVIIVENDPAEGKRGAERAIERMSEGVLVHIVGDKVKPKELRIATGQTVFFAVEDTDGITITDKTLLKKGKGKGKIAY
ncbi:MAG: hypothetical protein VXY73_07460 [Pseudomonadota bacterium]|jgi:plastocyanin|nr:hypothetical protein [Pseudomonadota bacterium]